MCSRMFFENSIRLRNGTGEGGDGDHPSRPRSGLQLRGRQQ